MKNRPAIGASGETTGSASSTQHVLIVDDEASVLQSVKTAFERAGRKVTACRTFEDAREKLLTGNFDALVTDVRLGAFNGMQLAIIARHLDPGIVIVVFSGVDDPVLRQEAERLGAPYLVKPVPYHHLVALTAVDRLHTTFDS